MTYYLLSIALVTLVFWGLYKAHILSVCPICAGVVITWVVGVAALYSGAVWANPLGIAILMGASVGALADKYGNKYGLFWKSAVVLLGVPAIYLLVQKSLWQSLALLAVIAVVTVYTKLKSKPLVSQKKDLFKDCC